MTNQVSTGARNVVITGAASGLGRGVAESAAARGDRLFLIDVDADALRATADALPTVMGYAAVDVSKADEVDTGAAQAARTLGHLDLVIHSAGVFMSGPAIDTEAESARWIIDVNVLGTMSIGRSFGRILVGQPRPSRLVLVASQHSLGVPHTHSSAYTASKHAVLGYADVLRRELPDHVRLSVLCPGAVSTNLWRSGEHRGAAYGGPQDPNPAGALAAQLGMPTSEVVSALWRGLDDDEFFIVTHGYDRRLARSRWTELDGAFERQAPDEDDERYSFESVRNQLRSKQTQS